MSRLFVFFALFFALALIAVVVAPGIDLVASGLFYRAGQGFIFRDAWLTHGLNLMAVDGARLLGLALLGLAIWAFWQRRAVWGLSAKGWAFLLVALLVGPGLAANVGLKDHWGRARPREIVAFGGTSVFTPALQPSDACHDNCSFVAGDAAFGFYLTTLAYLVPFRLRRRVFAGTLGIGSLFAAARLWSGAHFLSDILFALALILCCSAILHALFYGRQATKTFWNALIYKKT